MFEDFHWDETRAAATARRSTMRMFACCEEVLEQNKRSSQ
jgi:hypothetical protein